MLVAMPEPKTLKRQRAMEAAKDVFTRHGYARTTMGDIARAAGMSRPALYLLFSDKDAVFAAVVGAMDDAKHEEIRATLSTLPRIEDKLLRACLDWGLHGVELAEAHPDAADLFDLRFPVVRGVYTRFVSLVADLIAPDAAVSGIAASPVDLARTLVYGMRGLRAGSTDAADMRRLIEISVRTLTEAIGCRRGVGWN